VSFFDYTATLREGLDQALQAGLAVATDLQEYPKGATLGYVRGRVQFFDGSELHFREYVDTTLPEPRLMYVYHYQDAHQQLIFRYDDAAHKPALSQAEHKHTAGGIQLILPPSLQDVIGEIVRLLPPP
jgi:hypothetical protein